MADDRPWGLRVDEAGEERAPDRDGVWRRVVTERFGEYDDAAGERFAEQPEAEDG